MGDGGQEGAGFRQILLYYSLAQDYPLAWNPSSSYSGEINNFSTTEDAMKVPVTLLSLILAGAAFAAMPVGAHQAATEKKDAPTKETKWQGHVVRIDKDHSMMDIRGGSAPSEDPRKVAWDSSTEWTKLGKPAQQDEVKEGSFVILLGHVDHNGVLHATRIDLRLPR
jgi:hypothetical protein